MTGAAPLTAALAGLLAGCAPTRAPEAAPALAIARPDGCREVAPGTLAAALAAARDGDALCLAPGLHAGSVRIERRVIVWGPPAAIVRGSGGSVVVVTGAGARLAGFTIDGRGGRFDREDAAVQVRADDVVVEGLTVVHPIYGIAVAKAARVTVRGNHVRGDATVALGLRGDTIKLWETTDSVVADNLVEDGRDIVVFYSSRNRITGNRALRGRYGTHLMYSHDTVVADNRYRGVVVGVFVMYSHGDVLRRNLVADAGGAAGMAIGIKDSGGLVVEDNLLIRDGTGLYLDDSPNQLGDTVVVRGNVVRQCGLAVDFHTTPRGVVLTGNDLADNQQQVRLTAGTDAGAASWRGNYFDDYAGYDLDGDGTGDVAYVAHSASEDLIARAPELAFFRGGPVLSALDAAARLVPLWPAPALLIDPAPRIDARDVEEVLRAR